MQARDIVAGSPIVLRLDTPIPEAIQTLTAHGMTEAPVIDTTGAPVGVITEAELLRTWLTRAADPPNVGDVLTKAVIALPPTAELSEIAAAMLTYDVATVRLVEAATTVGVLSRADLFRAAGTPARPAAHETAGEAERRALRELARHRRGVPLGQ
jgi:CBS domain-containing protein